MKTDLTYLESGQWSVFLQFTTEGVPQPKGSARAYTYTRTAQKGGGLGARVEMDTRESRVWQRLVQQAGALAFHNLPLRRRFVRRGPIAVEVHCWLPQPKKLPKIRENEPSTKPDIDKLARCALDALTGVVFEDDAQIVFLLARKHYAPSLAVCRLEYTLAERADLAELPL